LAGIRKQRYSKTFPQNQTRKSTKIFNSPTGSLKQEHKMPSIQIQCPKCGSKTVEKQKNQEYHCANCGETFYFVTPDTGSSNNLERYNL
jgi:DNA-directed RNA polymerase subunit RPC12/RpoP